jgi:hypothetical protein
MLVKGSATLDVVAMNLVNNTLILAVMVQSLKLIAEQEKISDDCIKLVIANAVKINKNTGFASSNIVRMLMTENFGASKVNSMDENELYALYSDYLHGYYINHIFGK